MGQKRTTGLFKKRGIWQIDKQIFGFRIRESTGTHSLAEAELLLARRIEGIRQSILFGERIRKTFREGAARYAVEKQHKASIEGDLKQLDLLMPFIGSMFLDTLHSGSLQPFIQARLASGVKKRTVNKGLKVVQHLLNLAAKEWLDENGQTWLAQAGKIRLLKEDDKRRPYPITWEEQGRLFSRLPQYLRQMVLFKVNTGCREQEVCKLRWEWEIPIAQLDSSVFIIPKEAGIVKNGEDRLIVLNKVAHQVIEQQRGLHATYVFAHYHRGQWRPVYQMNNTSWQNARKKEELPLVRIHDLKHTFGRRLRSAGVSLEDRQDLLGHKSGRITTHYSAAEVKNLIESADKVCRMDDQPDTLALLRCVSTGSPTISPPRDVIEASKEPNSLINNHAPR